MQTHWLIVATAVSFATALNGIAYGQAAGQQGAGAQANTGRTLTFRVCEEPKGSGHFKWSNFQVNGKALPNGIRAGDGSSYDELGNTGGKNSGHISVDLDGKGSYADWDIKIGSGCTIEVTPNPSSKAAQKVGNLQASQQ